MEYEYDYDPVGNEESVPNVEAVEMEVNSDYERSNEPMEYTCTPAMMEILEEEENEKEANQLCWISLACAVLPTLLVVLLSLVQQLFMGYTTVMAVIYVMVRILLSIILPTFIAAVVLMIDVRKKYPQNAFGKGLMCFLIVVILIGTICAIAIMAFVVYLCNQLSTCAGMPYVLPSLLGGM